MHLPQKQDNSYSKSLSVKRPEETGTPPRSIGGNLFNEALTDGPGLKANPEPTQRQIGLIPWWQPPQGRGREKHCLKDKERTTMTTTTTTTSSTWCLILSRSQISYRWICCFYDTRLIKEKCPFTERRVDKKKRKGKQGRLQKNQVIVWCYLRQCRVNSGLYLCVNTIRAKTRGTWSPIKMSW